MSEEKIFRVGERISVPIAPTQFEVGKFTKARHPEPYTFDVNLTAEAGKMQSKTGTVSVNIPGFSPVIL